MPTLIKNVRNLHMVEFDRGKFDEWCVHLTRSGQERHAPRDTEYFEIFQRMGSIHGHEKVYSDFVSIYEQTNSKLDNKILELIAYISNTYGGDAEEMDIWFTVIYAGMVAEENKSGTILKKRIKRLGMHQLLVEGFEPSQAATFSIGKKWRELDDIMRAAGF